MKNHVRDYRRFEGNENFQIINLVIGLEGLEFLFNGELSFLSKF